MSDQNFDIGGEIIEISDLKISKAFDLGKVLISGVLDFIELFECRRLPEKNKEAIIFDIEVSVGQIRVYDIHRIERIAVIFEETDNCQPEVLALRSDFPKTPHQYLSETEVPRSLCLYELSYDEMKLSWTPAQFVKRINEWLRLTAKGKLHDYDQPLEPLLNGSGNYVIIPDDLFSLNDPENNESKILIFNGIKRDNGSYTLIAKECVDYSGFDIKKLYYAITLTGNPQQHGIINKQPSNLFELHAFLQSSGINLLSVLRERLHSIMENKPFPNIYEANMLLIVSLPKTRGESTSFESVDIWAFNLIKPIKEIGREIGIWAIDRGLPGKLLSVDINKNGNQIGLFPLSVLFSFSRLSAAYLNGLQERFKNKVTLIGVGALGSQVFMNLIRSGYGEWVLIDNDTLLPHNLARHALTGGAVGLSKADCVSSFANNTIAGSPISKSIPANVIHPGEYKEKIKQSFMDSDIILDISTSVAVERYISHDIESNARRVSMFLNPSGTDAVMLVEDKDRECPLDFLEMQYYRYIVENHMDNHLMAPRGRIRYSNSCRDISNTVSQENIAMYAAILSKAFRASLQEDRGSITVWSSELDKFDVSHKRYFAGKVIKHSIGEWTLCTDESFLNKTIELRKNKLPNETGGILIGGFDTQRKIVYVVDTIPSPPDSQEWPTAYIRGCQGLRSKLKYIQNITDNRLEYVGEWHSHPEGYGCNPSSDDVKAFNWLSSYMMTDGYPAVMLIRANDYVWLSDKFEKSESVN